MPFCELEQLTISVPAREQPLIDGVSLIIEHGEKVAIIGESGAGKSMTARAIAGIVPAAASVTGTIRVAGKDVTESLGSVSAMTAAHRAGVAMIFQDPRSHLDPRQRIGEFLLGNLRQRSAKAEAEKRYLATLADVHIVDPERCMRSFPHQLSGGMLQRVTIAAALVDHPALLIADEATAALDVTAQAQVCRLLDEAVTSAQASLLFVTHDLDLAAQLCDRAIVMRQGRIVDEFRFDSLRTGEVTEYTKHLLDSRPSGREVTMRPDTEPLLEVVDLTREFRQRRGTAHVLAVGQCSFEIREGSCLALVGESGSGKSTTARMLVGLERPDSGTISVAGTDLTEPPRSFHGRRRRARIVQLIQQDPYLSLDPLQTAREAIQEAQNLHKEGSAEARRAQLEEITAAVGLNEEMLDRHPRNLSGGQRQRVAIARALVTNPQVLVLDEAVSALDVSVQAQVLALLRRLRVERQMTMLFVTHDLNVVQALADEVIVMRAGRIVERGETAQVLHAPRHEYTKTLISAIPPRFEPQSSTHSHEA